MRAAQHVLAILSASSASDVDLKRILRLVNKATKSHVHFMKIKLRCGESDAKDRRIAAFLRGPNMALQTIQLYFGHDAIFNPFIFTAIKEGYYADRLTTLTLAFDPPIVDNNAVDAIPMLHHDMIVALCSPDAPLRNLETIELSQVTLAPESVELLFSAGEAFPSLDRITFDKVRCSNWNGLAHANLPKLRNLQLYNWDFELDQVYDLSFLSMGAQNLPMLRELTVAPSFHLQIFPPVESLFSAYNFENLEMLALRGWNMGAQGLIKLAQVVTGPSNLLRLDITDSLGPPVNDNIAEAMAAFGEMSAIYYGSGAPLWPNLEQIRLGVEWSDYLGKAKEALFFGWPHLSVIP